jgi:uncharacterized protein
MRTIATLSQERFIAYNKHYNSKNKAPYIVFSHGLMSNMHGSKALFIEEFCKKNNYNFIRFDNFGCGESSGDFISENISSWLDGLNLVIEKLTNGPVILIGSSAGAWISLLKTINNDQNNIAGLICISAAPDFTEELIWQNLTSAEKAQLQRKKIIEVKGSNPNCDHSYPISYDLIIDGRKNLLLKDEIKINCPVHLIHGMQDIDVPCSFTTRLAEKITSDQVVIKLIKDGDHRLARAQDLKILSNSIEEVIYYSTLG